MTVVLNPSVEGQPPVAMVPDDVVQKIVDFAFDMLVDILSVAVLSRRYNAAARGAANGLVEQRHLDARWLLTERMAHHFARWSLISVGGWVGSVVGSGPLRSIEIPEDDIFVYHCCRCRSPILRCRDIVSSNYHGSNGPAFLASHLYNAAVARGTYAAAFVTGSYTVSDVACAGCRIRLGKKYIDADDPENHFKVGKYLLEQAMVFAPRCCSSAAGEWLQSSRAPVRAVSNNSASMEVCARCAAHLQSRTLQAALLMTDGLRPGASRVLFDTLIAEGECVRHSGPRQMPAGISGVSRGASTAAGLGTTVGWKLAWLCDSLPGGVQPELLASFVGIAATTIAASIRAAALGSTVGAVVAAGPVPAEMAFGIEPGRRALVNWRLVRWALVSPTAAAISSDLAAARRLLAALRTTWQPMWPTERAAAERLLRMLATRLSLDKEDIESLWQELGCKTRRSGFIGSLCLGCH